MKKSIFLFFLATLGSIFNLNAQSSTLVSNIWELEELVINGNNIPKSSIVYLYDPNTQALLASVSNVVKIQFTEVTGEEDIYTLNAYSINGYGFGNFIISDTLIDSPPGGFFDPTFDVTGDESFDNLQTNFLTVFIGPFGGGTYTITNNQLRIGGETTYAVFSIYNPCNSINLPVGDVNQTLNEGQTLADLQITPATGYNLLWYADENLTTLLPATTPLTTSATYYVVNQDEECTSVPRPITVTVTPAAGLNENQLANLKIYPNPATDLLAISYQSTIENIDIFDVTGRKVLSKTVSDKQIQLEVNNLNSGIYIIKLKTEDGIGSKRFIKK